MHKVLENDHDFSLFNISKSDCRAHRRKFAIVAIHTQRSGCRRPGIFTVKGEVSETVLLAPGPRLSAQLVKFQLVLNV